MTILENVELPLIYSGYSSKERRDRELEALDKVGLSDRVKHKPNEISGGGQKQSKVRKSPLSELVTSKVITQVQSDEIMQKTRGNFKRTQN